MGTLSRLTICALLSVGISNATHATTADTYELGQAFPHLADQSLNAMWHVYVFERDGVRYVQINDTFGHVHAALAAHNHDYLVLPIGEDTDRVIVPNDASMCGDSCNHGVNEAKGIFGTASALVVEDSQSNCGDGCTHGAMASELDTARDVSNVIYQDGTLQITLTENAQAQPVWTVTGQPISQH